ncbi:MAG: sigma-70 family RNA polymerase sigma factor [Candidatus Hinthialibacter antarcticus]|nr:sigma-70 family RNA polymerase sigma factor [Candidatus Hinthialibacter antarcticus]
MNNTVDELTSIYLQHRNGLFACAFAVTARQDLAEDAVHNAFVRLYRNGKTIDATASGLKSYVFRSVRNAAIDLMRSRLNETPLDGHLLFTLNNDPSAEAQNEEFQQCVSDALLRMPQAEREVIIQRLYADLTFQEIADAVGAPLGSVTSWYRRGMERLRELLKVHDEKFRGQTKDAED